MRELGPYEYPLRDYIGYLIASFPTKNQPEILALRTSIGAFFLGLFRVARRGILVTSWLLKALWVSKLFEVFGGAVGH